MKTSHTLTAALAALLLTNSIAHAVSFTWDGGGIFGSEWSRDNNWNPNTQPPSDGTADLFFDGTSALDAEADSGWSIRSLTFNNGAGDFEIQGSPLLIGTGGITNHDSGTQSISNNLVLATAQTFRTTSTGRLDLFGDVNNGGHLLTVSLNAGPARFFSAISGAGGLTLTGGALTLADTANTYTGVTTVNAGNLLLFKASGVTAVPGALVIGGIGSVSLQADEQIANSSAVTVNSGGTLTFSSDGTETFGALTISGGNVLLNRGALTTSGVTMTGGTLDSDPTGMLTLGGNVVTAASATTATISPDALNLGNATRTFNVGDGAVAVDALLAATLSNGGLTKIGEGTLRLSGQTANTHTGLTRVNNGTLELGKPAGVNAIAGALTVGDGVGSGVVKLVAANQIGNGAVTIDGGTLDLNGFSETLPGALTMDGGVINTGAGTLTLNNNVTTSVNGAVVPAINGNLNLGTGTRTFTVNDAAATASDLHISAATSSGALTKAGAGTLVFNGANANTYTGATTVNVGELQLGKPAGVNAIAGPLVIGVQADVRLLASNQIADTSSVTLNLASVLRLDGFNETIGALSLNTASISDDAGTAVLTLGGDLTVGGTGTSQVFSRLNLGGATRVFNVADASAGSTIDLTILAPISNGAITKTGAGTMNLGDANTFAGGLTVTAGEVAFGNNIAAGTGTLALNGGAIRAQGSPKSLANAVSLGGDFTIGGTLALTLSGVKTLTGNRTITVTNTAATTFSNGIGQDVAGRTLTKAGAGTLTISGPQNYSGLVVTGGTVNLNTGVGTGSSAVAVTPGSGTATVNFTTSQTLAALTIGAGGVVNLSAAGASAVPETEFFADEVATFDEPTLAIAQPVPEPNVWSLLAAALLGLSQQRARCARPVPPRSIKV